MNLPNQLTIARLGITALFAVVLESDWRFARTTGLLLFAIASITDYADGYLARRHNLITDFGKLMDPLADKILMAAALIGLVAVDALPAWVATSIISREFLITGLRQLAAAKSIVLPAERIGKHKTIWQMITILYFLLLQTIEEWSRGGWIPPLPFHTFFHKWVGGTLVTFALILTLGSGLGYLWKNRTLIQDR
ncbi:MAG: CDP-diacylglycerol--glycerol-3-phosphate 3-phosphatidyltransferase [Verrucomicrobiota bacterium]